MRNVRLIKQKPTITIDTSERQKSENRVPPCDYSPCQKMIKRPRPINYRAFPEIQDVCRDIVVMYVYLGLGESAIRHIIGDTDDKLIEDVVRQHNFGRNNINKGELTCTTKLYCPNKKELTQRDVEIIRSFCDKYETLSDPYNIKVMEDKTWNNDPSYVKERTCPNCGNAILVFEDNFCSRCGYKLRRNVKYVKELQCNEAD